MQDETCAHSVRDIAEKLLLKLVGSSYSTIQEYINDFPGFESLRERQLADITAALDQYGKEQYNRAIEDAANEAAICQAGSFDATSAIRALAQKDVKP